MSGIYLDVRHIRLLQRIICLSFLGKYGHSSVYYYILKYSGVISCQILRPQYFASHLVSFELHLSKKSSCPGYRLRH